MRRAMVAGLALLLAGPVGAVSAQILSSKRGFADTGAGYANLQVTNSGWYYTWGTGTGSPGSFDAKHYPMIWSGTPSQSTLNNLLARNPAYVLGFNEPERTDQANMTVAQAISAWTPMSNAFTGTNVKLVSPAVADTGGATGGQQWLSSFMSQAATNNLKVDAVAFHWYGVSTPTDPAGAASSFLSRVQSYYNSYQKPVFITEFAIHDWGGAYSDQEIAEANRQFLNIVIPQLESRSYVAGYAWYHWFGDAGLYTSNATGLVPTALGLSYLRSVGAGSSTDIGSGQVFGEHVAYLSGGQLTYNTGAATTLKYVNNVVGEGALGGTADWSLAGSNNWVRIQANSRLSKTGTNTVTINNGTVTNYGVLEVARGQLNLGSNVTGPGSVRVKGGTLALSNAATLRTVPFIDVRSGAILDVTALSGGVLGIVDGRTLQSTGAVRGNVSIGTSSIGSLAGTITGNLTTVASSNIRVGTDRLGTASRSQLEDFEPYTLGNVTSAGSPWTAHLGTTAAAFVDVGGTKALAFGSTSGFAATSRQLPSTGALEEGLVGTYFFRVNAIADNLNHALGLGDAANPNAADFGDFETQLRLKQGTSAGTFAVDARSGTAFTSTLASGLSLNTWYNFWMVVDQTTDRYDLYMNTGTGAATAGNKLNASSLLFRNGTAQDLDTFLAYAGGVGVANAVRFDSLTFGAGTDLSNPLSGFDPNYTWLPQTLNVVGNHTHQSGAVLRMDLGTTGGVLVGDTISVGGTLTLSSSLKLELAEGFIPTLGQSKVLISHASRSGVFSSIDGVSLSSDLALAVTYEANEIRVTLARPGDADLSGGVDFNDLLALAQNYQGVGVQTWATGDFTGNGLTDFNDLLALAQNYNLGAASFETDWALAQSLVPEPATLSVLAIGATLLGRGRRAASASRSSR